MVTQEARALFGELLQDYRTAAGLSQQELAVKAGLSRRGISDLERGERRTPHPATVRQLAEALGLSPRDRAVLLKANRTREPVRGVRPQRAYAELPHELTSFVGREQEMAEVRRLLNGTRLLTLMGSGGIGKTRLALKVAEAEDATYLDGVWLVELASLAEPALVVQAVASALGVSDKGTEPPLQTLKKTLRSKRLLLVLDNCEHLVVACVQLIEVLLRTSSGLRILATSREPLGLQGETGWRVPPLCLPDPRDLLADGAAESEAVALFVERAAASERTFALTSQNRAAVFQICHRLDGIPLAIELAAARVNALTVEQIAARLDDSLSLLTGGGRTTVDRQRTLRGTLDWSYDLLSDPEQRILYRLAVFAGGWSLEAAEAVCGDEAATAYDVLDLLSALVNKSLVVADQRGQGLWYRLLDPLRAYASEKLHEAGDAARMQARHRDWYTQLAERFEAEWRGPRQRAWFDSLGREEDNIRAALRSCIDRSDITQGLRLAGALYRFWDLRNRLTEGRAWLAELIRAAGIATPAAVMAKALGAAGYLTAYQGDATAGEAYLMEALRLWRGLDNGAGIAGSLIALGTTARLQNDLAGAEALLGEALTVAREADDQANTYWALCMLARSALQRGDLQRAQALNDDSLALKQRRDDAFAVALSLHVLAHLAWLRGEHEAALSLVQQTLALLGELGHWRAIGMALQLLAHIAADGARPELAATLFGAVETLQESLGYMGSASTVLLSDIDPTRTEQSLAACRAELTSAEFETAWAAGQAMTTDEAVGFALRATRSDAAASAYDEGSRSVSHSRLTERETQVLRLIVEGNTNREIATTLVLSPRTVERHIANVYAKLGARNRAGVTAYAVRHGLASIG